MLAQDVALLIVVVLLLSHQDLQPDPILCIHSRQGRIKACDTSLCLFYIIFEQVAIHNEIDSFRVSLAIGDEDAESVPKRVVDGADGTRDRVQAVLEEDDRSKQNRFDCVLFMIGNERSLDQAFERC